MNSAARSFRRGVHSRALLASLVATLVASALCFAAESDLHRGKPDIWGVWLGTGGYPDIDPRYRNTPWPTVEFTAWGAAESKRLTTPETPDECMPYGPMSYMGGGSLFPFEIVKATKGLVLLYEPSPVPRRIYTDGRKHPEDVDPTSWMKPVCVIHGKKWLEDLEDLTQRCSACATPMADAA